MINSYKSTTKRTIHLQDSENLWENFYTHEITQIQYRCKGSVTC